MQTRPRPVPVLAACLLALAAASHAASAADSAKAPTLRLTDLEGKPASVEYGEAAVTLVNFWATWCMPCREEMPQIDRLSKRYADKGLKAVGIALQSGGSSEVKEFVEGGSLQLSYPLLVGDDDVGDGFGGVEIVPTTFLVGRDGRIHRRVEGAPPDLEASLSPEIDKILAAAKGPEKSPAP